MPHRLSRSRTLIGLGGPFDPAPEMCGGRRESLSKCNEIEGRKKGIKCIRPMNGLKSCAKIFDISPTLCTKETHSPHNTDSSYTVGIV